MARSVKTTVTAMVPAMIEGKIEGLHAGAVKAAKVEFESRKKELELKRRLDKEQSEETRRATEAERTNVAAHKKEQRARELAAEKERAAVATSKAAALRLEGKKRNAQERTDLREAQELKQRLAAATSAAAREAEQKRHQDTERRAREAQQRKAEAEAAATKRKVDEARWLQKEKLEGSQQLQAHEVKRAADTAVRAGKAHAAAKASLEELAAKTAEREHKTREHEASVAQARATAERGLATEREREAVALENKLGALREKEEAARAKRQQERELALVAERVAAESKARIEEERQNEDVRVRQREQEGSIGTDRAVRVATLYVEALRDGAKRLVSDPEAGLRVVALVGGMSVAFFGSREGLRLARTRLEAVLGRPSLVRETSIARGSPRKMMANALKRIGVRGGGMGGGGGSGGDGGGGGAFGNVVLEPAMEARIQSLGRATRNTHAHKAPFRHVLFYGPPGTGKTLVAKQLARHSGLDYAIMSGGDVGPLRETGERGGWGGGRGWACVCVC